MKLLRSINPRYHLPLTLSCFAALLGLSSKAAAVDFPGSYSQNFDSMATGTAAPTGWTFYGALGGSTTTWTSSIPAADAGLGTANATLVVASPSAVSSDTAGYNFPAGTASNRCLGSSPTSGRGGVWQLSLTNTRGWAIQTLELGYDIHRFTAPGTANELPGYRLFYSLNGGTTWTNVAALNPVISGGTVNVPNSTGATAVSGAELELSAPWAAGANLLLRWVDDNAGQSSPDQILGLDNVSITAAAAPTFYTQNFDSMGTGTAAPTGWSFHGVLGGSKTTWASSIPVADAGLGTANATLVATSPSGVSSDTAGYNFPAGTSPNRCVGSSPTTGRGGVWQLSLTNTLGGPVNTLEVGYDIHRFTVASAANELPGYRLFYSLNGGTSWTNVATLNPAISGGTVNVPNTTGATTVPLTGIDFATPWTSGATLLLRWIDDNADQSSPDQILGLDNVSLAANVGTSTGIAFPGSYTQNFDAMGASGTAAPAGWAFHGALGGGSTTWASSIAAADAGLGTANATLIAASPSGVSSNSSGYNFPATSASDRCLGTSPTSGRGGLLQLALTNTSGAPVTTLEMSYEIHRFTVGSAANELPGYQLFYSLNGGSTWTNASILNPSISGGSVTVPNTTGITSVAAIDVDLASAWAPGGDLLLRWIDDNAEQSSPDQILGLDDVSITAVPTNLPPAITLTSPADDATDLGSPLTLQAAVSDPEGGAMTVTFYGREKAVDPGPDFTLVTLPDTQYYSQDNNNRFSQFLSQTNWIVSSKSPLNTAFVAHMGDMVQTGDSIDAEWQRADQAMDIIEDPVTTFLTHGIPWGGAPGNHDGNGTKWNQYFGSARWSGRPYFQGNYGGSNTNNYQFFSASGLDFIVINLAYNSSPAGDQAVMDWADALLKANPNRRAIITSHWLIGTGNQALWGGHGETLYNNLKDNPNLFLMLCGHVHGEGQRMDEFEERKVYTILQDYQDRTGAPGGYGGGDAWLRYYIFSPAENKIKARTYRTTTGAFEEDTDSKFEFEYNMSSGPWVELATVGVSAGGTSASTQWTGLDPDKEYEWYAAVSDGSKTDSSGVFGFTTAPPPEIDADAPSVSPGFGKAGSVASGTFTGGVGSLNFTATRNGVAFGSVTWDTMAGTWSWSKTGLTPADNGTIVITITNGIASDSVSFTLSVGAAQFSPIPDLALYTPSANHSRLLRIAELLPTAATSAQAKVYWGSTLQATTTINTPFGYHDLTLVVPAVPGGQSLPWTTEVAVEVEDNLGVTKRRTFKVTIFSTYSVASTVSASSLHPESISDNGDITGYLYTTSFTTDGYPGSEVPWFGTGPVFSSANLLPRILQVTEWYGYGNGVNNYGAVAGSGYSHSDLTDEDRRPLYWASSTSTPLVLESTGLGEAEAINDYDEIAGHWEPPSGGYQATSWVVSGGSASRITLPGAGPYSTALSINNAGTIAGIKNFWTGTADTCVWEQDGSGGYNMPVALNPPSGGQRGSYPVITDSGLVYSSYGYRWKKTGQTWNPVPEALTYGYDSVNYHGLGVAGGPATVFDTGVIGGPVVWDLTPIMGSNYWSRCINNDGQIGIYIYSGSGGTVFTPVVNP